MPTTCLDVFRNLRHRKGADRPWVDIAQIHNALTDNHFLDILSIYGTDHGFSADEGPAYASRLRALSSEFRRQVIGALVRSYSTASSSSVVAIPPENLTYGAPSARNTTRQALKSSAAIIINPVLANEDCRIIARLPLLLRPDVAQSLLDFPQVDYYVPVIIKRRNIQLVGSDPKALRPSCITKTIPEAYIWIKLLSEELSIEVSHAAVIGLSPSRKLPVPLGAFTVDTSSSHPYNPDVWRSAILAIDSVPEARGQAERALLWRTAVADEGKDWLSSSTSIAKEANSQTWSVSAIHALAACSKDPRKRPNMKAAPMYDWPWAGAKRTIAEDICELTLMSGVNNVLVKDALGRDLPNNYKDDRITAESLGASMLFTERALLMCKRDYVGPKVVPQVIRHNRFNWRLTKTFDLRDPTWFGQPADRLPFAEERSFYVDFELASIDSLFAIRPNPNEIPQDAKELSNIVDVLPAQAGSVGELRPIIFLIGCGRLVKGEWSYRAFIADTLDTSSESKIIQKWLEYMDNELPDDVDTPYVYVWGPEQQLLKKAMKHMNEVTKASVREKCSFNVVNMLQVVITGGLVIQGNYSNGLKRVGNALDGLGLLPAVEEGPMVSDVRHGLDVMAFVLDAVESMRDDGIERLSDVGSMKQSETYNEMDCLHLARITSYLRENH